MVLKMHQVLEFQSLYNEIKNQKMSIKTAYKFSKLASKLDAEIKFYQTKMQEILQKYGEKDEEGNFKLTENKEGIILKQEDIHKCQEETEELHNLEVEILGISFSLDELEGLDVTIQEMNVIMSLLEER